MRLSACTQLIKDLELSATSRLDFWQGEWVTVELESVLTVEKGQRVLFKIRESLRQPLKDTECPGLSKELDLQPRKFRVLKHGAEDELVSPLQKAPCTSQTTVVNNAGKGSPRAMKSHLNVAPTPSTQDTTSHMEQPHSNPNPRPVIKAVQPPPSSPPTPPRSTQLNKPHTKARHWPHQFYVCEIRDGLLEMSKLLGTAFSRRRTKNNSFNKRDAFHKAFPGVKYVKTTTWKYKKLWDDSDEAIRELFTDLGKTENAYFEHFLAALDDPHLLPPALDESETWSADSGSDHEGEDTISQLVIHAAPSDPQSPDKGKARDKPKAVDPHCTWPPVNIDFDSLHYRVNSHQETLEEILFDPVESEIFRSLVMSFEAGSSSAQHSGLSNGVAAG